MNINIKRGLAIAAIAPLSIVGFAGAAGASTGDPQPASLLGNSHGFGEGTCQKFSEDWFSVQLDRVANGGYGYEESVDEVTVTAVDNQGHGDWFDSAYHVTNIAIDYKTDGDSVYHKVSTGARHGGVATFTHNQLDVEQVKVTVNWYKFGNYGSMSLKCTFDLD